MKFINSITKKPKIISIILDLLIPFLLYFSLQNGFQWSAWILFGVIVLIRSLIAIKN